MDRTGRSRWRRHSMVTEDSFIDGLRESHCSTIWVKTKLTLSKTLSSLPSSYALNWLGQDTFNAVSDKLGAGEFAPDGYPSKEGADPYNPPAPDQNGRVRYATGLGFSLDELKLGRDVCKKLVADLPDDLARKFFNIRGVQRALGRTLEQTICGTN